MAHSTLIVNDKELEKKLSALEHHVDKFGIVGASTSGSFATGFAVGGGSAGSPTVVPPKEKTLEARIAALESHFDNFRIYGNEDVIVEGSFKSGFIINKTAGGGGGIGGISTPMPVSTAILVESGDFLLTELGLHVGLE